MSPLLQPAPIIHARRIGQDAPAPAPRRREHPHTAASLRLSMSFITNTSAVLGPGGAGDTGGPAALDLLGYVADDHALYFLEHSGEGGRPQLQLMHTRGAHAGRMVPVRGVGGAIESGVRLADRVAELERDAIPLRKLDADDWFLSTRVIQRRALRVSFEAAPIRKFVLELRVRPWLADDGDSSLGRTTVTAYLRPQTRLVDVHRIPGEALAVVRVAYVGVPGPVGHEKVTALLVSLR